jgi:S-formylglutathione hydrolase
MRFGIYLPEYVLRGERRPVLYWLSGLTCTEQNFITKAGAQKFAAKHQLIVVSLDTSPRGETVPDEDIYCLGQGASFYINSTTTPWAEHFQMQDYVSMELPALIESYFLASNRRSIFGHSMGGHGALVTALRNPGRYKSVSAFSPIVAPTQVPWGRKAFHAYLGMDSESWKDWDAVELVGKATERLPLLIDQGGADEFLVEQLRPELLTAACNAVDFPIELKIHSDYDHSYYFIASFIGRHFLHHAAALSK